VANEFAAIERRQALCDGGSEFDVIFHLTPDCIPHQLGRCAPVAGSQFGQPRLFFGGQLHVHLANLAVLT
jgi:hypothetical protein